MKILGCVLVITLVTGSGALAALIEANIEVDPVLSHCYEYYEETGHDGISDWLVIQIPDFTLDPGDVFRVNVGFGGKSLKVVNDPAYVWFSPWFLSAGYGTDGDSIYSNAVISLTLRSYENVDCPARGPDQPVCRYFEPTNDFTFHYDYFWVENGVPALTSSSLFGDFTVEFTAPTIIALDDTLIPFSTKTYSGNLIRIAAELAGEPGIDRNVFVVVPEPASVLLLGLGGLALVRKRTK